MNVCLKQSHLWFCSIFRSFGNPTAAAYLGGKSSIYFDVSQRTKPPARTASGISMISHVGWLEGNSWYPLVISRSYGKSPFSMGKSTISMAIFNSYVSLPEGHPKLEEESAAWARRNSFVSSHVRGLWLGPRLGATAARKQTAAAFFQNGARWGIAPKSPFKILGEMMIKHQIWAFQTNLWPML